MSTKVLSLPTPIVGIRPRTLSALAATAAAVAFPQAFHLAGIAAGAGPAFAQAWLPMFVPVMLVGLLAGPSVGAITGVAGPLVAYALTGMPAPALLPIVAVELVACGVVAGVVSGKRLAAAWATLLVVVAAPVASFAVESAVGLIGGSGLASAVGTWWAQWVVTGPGLILQVAAVAITLAVIRRHR